MAPPPQSMSQLSDQSAMTFVVFSHLTGHTTCQSLSPSNHAMSVRSPFFPLHLSLHLPSKPHHKAPQGLFSSAPEHRLQLEAKCSCVFGRPQHEWPDDLPVTQPVSNRHDSFCVVLSLSSTHPPPFSSLQSQLQLKAPAFLTSVVGQNQSDLTGHTTCQSLSPSNRHVSFSTVPFSHTFSFHFLHFQSEPLGQRSPE